MPVKKRFYQMGSGLMHLYLRSSLIISLLRLFTHAALHETRHLLGATLAAEAVVGPCLYGVAVGGGAVAAGLPE